MNKGILYIIATPIGNLEDITLRALRMLKEVNLIACEDTRVTKKLLRHYEIKTPVISYFQHSKPAKTSHIISQLEEGNSTALVTDAGTPGISDPGNILVSEAIEAGINVIPIPGASALTAIASVSGINMQKFSFFAFPPHKKGRETFFKVIASSKNPVVYYESPHRVIKNLNLLASFKKDAKIIVGRELTKMFEDIIRSDIKGALSYFEKNKGKVKGEFTIIVY